MSKDIVGEMAKTALELGTPVEAVDWLVTVLDAFSPKLREMIAQEIEHFPMVWTGTANPDPQELEQAQQYKDEYVKMFAEMVRNPSDYWS